jgi:acetoin:2,6-dichlorophenolindophenol oxidoreductase subunit beta
VRKTTYIQAVNEALRDEMRRDPSVFLIGEDVGRYGGLFRVTRNLYDEFGPKRVIDTPISEQAFMGMALGAAMVGMRPIVELMYMDFFLVCADQIFNQIAKMRYMSGGQVQIPLVIRGQQGGGKRYGAQHSQSVESVFAHFPGIKVLAPSTPYDAKGLLASAIRDNNPVLFLEHKMLYFTTGDVPAADEEFLVPIGKADVKRPGKDLTLVTYSYCQLEAQEAATVLSQEHGIDVEIVDLRTIVPLDMETVLTSVQKTGRLLAVHESYANSGVGAEIVARIYEEAPELLRAPARRLGAPPVPMPVSLPLEDEVLPWRQQIIATVLDMFGKERNHGH